MLQALFFFFVVKVLRLSHFYLDKASRKYFRRLLQRIIIEFVGNFFCSCKFAVKATFGRVDPLVSYLEFSRTLAVESPYEALLFDFKGHGSETVIG